MVAGKWKEEPMTVRNILVRSGVVAMLALMLACSKPEQPMPLTKENIVSYRNKLVDSQNALTAKDRENASKSPEGAADLFSRTFVKPMEDMGYSYDKTIRLYAHDIVDGKIPVGDPDVKTLAEGVVLMAKMTGDVALKNGFITEETKKLLDRINLK
jgi:hypothetical protein